MTNYEQEARSIINLQVECNRYGQLVSNTVSVAANRISTLHDTEMIEFAEWCTREATWDHRTGNSWLLAGADYTTAELLKIFREEGK